MANQKDKTDSLHDQMPAGLDTRVNPNWKALLEAIGERDQETIDLIESVRQQFFVKTATRPYIDRLGSANLVQRPRFVGMDDTIFREFIPVMSYQPKQVKLVLDKLLDLFFFKESTTSFIESDLAQPFNIKDGWELEYQVDSFSDELIEFKTAEFTNIAAATANEVVAAINRQATSSYAIAFEDSITKETNIRIFTNTIGSKGSVEMTGGRANISLEFEGYNTGAGHGGNSQWQVTKTGDTVTLTYTGTGNSPNIEQLQVGDIVMINRTGNVGSFVLTEVDPSNDLVKYKNLFATAETFTQTTTDDVKFMTPFKSNVYLKDRRAVIWEVQPGEVVVEMPPSPPVVKRNRKGAAHINGIDSLVTSLTTTTMTIATPTPADFPTDGGRFFFIPLNEIQTYYPGDAVTTSFQYESRLSSDLPVYTYTSRAGSVLSGVSPDLPTKASTNQINLTSANRDASNVLTVTTAAVHDYVVGEYAIIDSATQGAGTGLTTNGTWKITNVISDTVFEAYSFSGPSGTKASTTGTVRVERANIGDGGRVILTSAQLDPDLEGPFLWDENSDFTLSSLTTTLTTQIEAGSIQRNILVAASDIPDEEGQLIFDFGTEKQEGPVRYFFKPNATTLALDPSYVFSFTHDVASSVAMIRRRGGIQFDSLGSERAPYITDPAAAREVLQELMQELKSVGIFINFLIRYPEQFYATIDVYRSGVDPG